MRGYSARVLVCLMTLANASALSRRGLGRARDQSCAHCCLKRHSNSKPQRNRAAPAAHCETVRDMRSPAAKKSACRRGHEMAPNKKNMAPR